MGATQKHWIKGVFWCGLLCGTLGVGYASPFWGGTGEPNDPYQIATVADLIELGSDPCLYDRHFILTADIDLDPDLPSGRVFDRAVIAPDVNEEAYDYQGEAFAGCLDGQGHVIRNLQLQGQGFLGLFGRLDAKAEVRDLGLEGLDVNGVGPYVGGLASCNEGLVIACYAKGVVRGTISTGVLLGRNEGTLLSCFSQGEVAGASAGGLVGTNIYGRILCCYSHVDCGGDDGVGGLVGFNYCASISLCYSVGGSGLVLYNEDGVTTLSFWDREVSLAPSIYGGTGLTTAQMQDIATFLNAGWDFAEETANGTGNFWIQQPGQYPELAVFTLARPGESNGMGTSEDPYPITDINELGTVWYRPLGHYRLMNDLDLTGSIWPTAIIPVLNGSLDGHEAVIHNLCIQGGDYLGLVGQLQPEASLTNLRLESVDVNGTDYYAAGLLGYNLGGSIRECHVTSRVQGVWRAIGGLVGYHNGGVIEACSSRTTVKGYGNVGGLVGEVYAGAILFSGSDSTVMGESIVGGLVGRSTWGDIRECSSRGLVYSQDSSCDNAGGLVGHSYGGLIENCYSLCAVQGGSDVGGFLGDSLYDEISSCYSAGAVNFQSSGGGFLGGSDLNSQMVACFWDTETSGQLNSVGGTGLTTAEMQDVNTYLDAGWDFVEESGNGTENVWWMPEGDSPRFWWEDVE